MKQATICFFSLCFLFCSLTVFSVRANDEESPEDQKIQPSATAWKAGVYLVEKEILFKMLGHVESKEWHPAWAFHQVYRFLGSNKYAKVEIARMIREKNADGGAAVIRLTQTTIDPFHSPIISTNQVKKTFVWAMQNTDKEKWECKTSLLQSYLSIFNPENAALPEKTALLELQQAIEKKESAVAATTENILFSILNYGFLTRTPLDERPEYTYSDVSFEDLELYETD